ncbi:uncharacterized protein LOC144912987 isoform X1 [Branchiostoma floridae x Branchiostoma belcheri]
MPSNAEFGFSVLVGGHVIPEYQKDREVFVETNLYSPVSYKEKVVSSHRKVEEIVVDGQTEVNEWPVTPYTIEITTHPHAPLARYTISVDGFIVTKVVLTGGQSRVVKGFHDNEKGGLASFVFSLPRYAKNESADRRQQKLGDVGTIRVTSNDTWKKWLYHQKRITKGHKGTPFVPASKRDALAVTSGQYTMVTTRMGQNIPVAGSWASFVRRWRWTTGMTRGVLEVKCRTEDTIREMGFQIQPYPVILSMNNNIPDGTSREVRQASTGDLEIQLHPVNNNKVGEVSTASVSRGVQDSSVDGWEIPCNHSCESTVVNPAPESETFDNTNMGASNIQVEMNLLNGGSRRVQLPEDSTARDAQVKPLESSVEETAMTDMEVTELSGSTEPGPGAMEITACSASREVKAEDLVKKTEEDSEYKPNIWQLQHELIDLTADDEPEVVDLTTDNYLPDVYEVKFTTKIEVVYLEEEENNNTSLPMQT